MTIVNDIAELLALKAEYIGKDMLEQAVACKKKITAKEEDIIGKQQEFFKGWSDGIFYSCNYGGQSATYNSYTIREFLDNREFFLVNQEKAFADVFADNGLTDKNTEVFVHRITCNGKTVSERKVMYPFVTVEGSNKGFYVYEGAVIIFEYDD